MNEMKSVLMSFLDEHWELHLKRWEDLRARLEAAPEIIVFGAGEMGRCVAQDLLNIGLRPAYFCDNNSANAGQEIVSGISCISFHALATAHRNAMVVIASGHYQAIRDQLDAVCLRNHCVLIKQMIPSFEYWRGASLPWVKHQIGDLLSILEDELSIRTVDHIVRQWFMPVDGLENYGCIAVPDQYFPQDIIRLGSEETIVDAGAFDGDTVMQFIERTDGRFRHIHAYELDAVCFEQLSQTVSSMDAALRSRISIYPLGLFSDNRSVVYTSASASSSIGSSGDRTGQVVRLSDQLADKKVTFIKMDIEGCELDALRGSAELITRCMPTLAVCIYHQPDHLWAIPQHIKVLCPEYRIRIRHHSPMVFETVCYATCN